MLELASLSTSAPSGPAVTTTSCSRTRLAVACSRQCTRVPAPCPPASTRYSLYCSGSTAGRVVA